jgi:hypothetical protein
MIFARCLFIHSAMGLRLTLHLGRTGLVSNIGLFSKLQLSVFKARIDPLTYQSARPSKFATMKLFRAV